MKAIAWSFFLSTVIVCTTLRPPPEEDMNFAGGLIFVGVIVLIAILFVE